MSFFFLSVPLDSSLLMFLVLKGHAGKFKPFSVVNVSAAVPLEMQSLHSRGHKLSSLRLQRKIFPSLENRSLIFTVVLYWMWEYMTTSVHFDLIDRGLKTVLNALDTLTHMHWHAYVQNSELPMQAIFHIASKCMIWQYTFVLWKT